MSADEEIVHEIFALTHDVDANNVGDNYVSAVELYGQIKATNQQQRGEYYIAQIRSVARKAEIGWKIFTTPPRISQPLSEEQQIRLLTIIATLDAFCYGFERLDEASSITGPSSTPVRFYINSLYHYISALYLLDKGDDSIGGMINKTFEPMGLSNLLDPVKNVLNKPMEGAFSFGYTILKIRNKFLVHGSFSPDDISSIVNITQLQDNTQQIHLTNLLWELFNQSIILKLKLTALLTALEVDLGKLTKYLIEKDSMP